ncbi:hypothetical protein MG293_012791 [Ovis ammon polii]|uniref:Guanine nucleotide exchange factor MSS4 n=1 Tax=Ovis ammon polii TaxID=230172 RepID=A0AAD4TZ43_OVIAM|nr:hypothetical protein MG293_012791 [Ovis ammon polii]
MEAPAPPSELVSEEGRNRKAVLCRRCGSRVLQPGTALFSRRQLFLPSMRKKPALASGGGPEGDLLQEHWLVEDMFTFENVGFTKDVGNIKFLVCADCELVTAVSKLQIRCALLSVGHAEETPALTAHPASPGTSGEGGVLGVAFAVSRTASCVVFLDATVRVLTSTAVTPLHKAPRVTPPCGCGEAFCPAPHETQIRGPGTTPDLIGQHVGGKEADRPTLSSRDPDEAPDGLEGEEIYRADLLLKCVAA